MEEEEFELFDPSQYSTSPRNVEEIDLCIEYANNCLLNDLMRSIPNSQDLSRNNTVKDLKYCTPLSVNVPMGNFFYPCSGNDYEIPVDFFYEYVNEFHFSDAFNRNYVSTKSQADTQNIKSIPWIGNIVTGNFSTRQITSHGKKIFLHGKDGLLTFLDDIVNLSIFFYRGDSSGEGGSNQIWQGPVLLDMVLMRIQNGGLLCTDDSNGIGPLFNELRKSNEVNYKHLKIRRVESTNLRILKHMKFWQVCYDTKMLNLLLTYCSQNRRVCPKPKRWSDLYKILSRKASQNAVEEPSPPLILAAWNEVSLITKIQRFKEHIEWANVHGVLNEVDTFLRGLSDADWHHLDE